MASSSQQASPTLRDVLTGGLETLIGNHPTVACFAMLWTRYCTSPDLYCEFAQCSVSLPTVGEPPNFGPMHFSYEKLAKRISSVLMNQFATCLVTAVCGNSSRLFLRNCAHRTECFPMVQQYYWGRLYIARFLSTVIRKITPRLLSRAGFGIRWEDSTSGNEIPVGFGETGAAGAGGGVTSFFLLFPGRLKTSPDGHEITAAAEPTPSGGGGASSITTKSASAAQFIELLVNQSLLKDHQTQGVWKTVVQTHLIDYCSSFLVDQINWGLRLYRCRKVKRKAMLRMYLVTTMATVIDNLAFLGLRVAGAYIGYGMDCSASYLFGSVNNGLFTFLGENTLQFLGYITGAVMNRSNHWGMRLYAALQKKMPLNEAEEDDQTRCQEEHSEQERDKQQRYQEVHKAAEAEVNYYAALGVSQEATQDEIKKHYRKLALKLHPDKISSLPDEQREAAAVEFKKMNAAYSVISDPQKRREYDAVAHDLGTVNKPYHPGFIMRMAMAGPLPVKILLTGTMVGFTFLAFPRIIYYQLFMIFKNFSAAGPGMVDRMMRRMGSA